MFNNAIISHRARSPWYSSGGKRWGIRVPIEINTSQVPSTQTDFPVYINLAHLPTIFYSRTQSAGQDLRITTLDGTEVPFEIVAINTGTPSGELYFKAPSIADGSVFYIYSENPSASAYAVTDTYGAQNVWANYRMVHHFSTGSSPTQDSTSNNYDGTVTGATHSATSGLNSTGGYDYTGADTDGINYGTALTGLSVAGAIECWIKPDTVPTTLRSVLGDSGGYCFFDFGGVSEKFRFALFDGAGKNVTALATASAATWYHLMGTWDGTNANNFLINGVSQGTIAAGNIAVVSNNVISGDRTAASLSPDGVIDGVRISTVERSTNWALTQYRNQSAPSSFYTVGGIQFV